MSALDIIVDYAEHIIEEIINDGQPCPNLLATVSLSRKELADLRNCLAECEDNLKSMVEQYCRNGYFNENDDMSRNKYSHDFMSAGECTFEYLVARGLAEYLENGVDIRLKPLEEK